ncbi:MAG: flagellar protein FlbD [Planctomycetota bacterium]|nr:MAG: flagellar protein FlbD [Planctomycetota bacterium]
MINLTKLNKKEFILNGELIKFIENVPDTLITLINGEKVFVLETSEEVILKVIEYNRMNKYIPELM